MSEINISLFRQIVDPLLASQPDLAQQLLPILAAADSDGTPNEEDNILTDAEARNFLERNRSEAARGRSILTRNRDELAGELGAARSRLESAGASEELLALLEQAAAQEADFNPDDEVDENQVLSAEELELLVSTYEQQYQALGGGSLPDNAVENFMNDVRTTLRDIRNLRDELPEAFVPTTEAEQRETIDLNFLKELPLSVFFARTDDGEPTEQAQLLNTLVRTGGIELDDRESDWNITFEELNTALASMPSGDRAELPNEAALLMANMRFIARILRDQWNATVGEAVAAGGDGEGIDLRPLLARGELTAHNPIVNLYSRIAGSDGILTRGESDAHVQRINQENPASPVNPDVFYAAAAQMVADLTGASDEELSTISETMQATRDDILNQRVLDDLENMREGFTATDRDYVENDSIFAFANAGVHVFSFLGTLGIYHLAGGPSYRDAMRESVEWHDSERGHAIQALRRLVESPSREFRNWLATRDEGERTANIPNALEFLRTAEERYEERVQTILTTRLSEEELNRYTEAWRSGDPAQRETIPPELREYVWFMAGYDGEITEAAVTEHLHLRGVDSEESYVRYHELLVSHLLQADRLWNIHSMEERGAMEDAWYTFAEDIRDGYLDPPFFGINGTHLDGLGNPSFARAILHGLRRQSPTPEMRTESRHAYQDSLGVDITTDAGEIEPGLFGWTYFNEGGGELGLWPPDWFRNYSDEHAGAAISDVALVIATWKMGGMLFRGFTRLMSGGLSAAGRGVVTFLGWNILRGSSIAGITESTTVAAHGWFSRRLADWSFRRASQASDRLVALEAVGTASSAEMAAAREAFTRAERVHQILSAPTGVSAGGAAVAAMEHAPWAQALATSVTTRLTALAERWSERWVALQNNRVVNVMATGIWLTGLTLRGAGRFLRYMSYEGIVTLGIAGYLFENAPRHSNHPLLHDREYDLHLPEEEDTAPRRRRRERPETPLVAPTDDPAPEEGGSDRDSEGPRDHEDSAVELARGIVEEGE